MTTNFKAFTYCWTDKKTKKLYVGVHLGDESDGYICSSEAMLDEFSIRPDDFSREIIARGNFDDMIRFECALLKTFNAAKDPLFYNAHNGDGKFYNKGHTKKTREKLKIARNKRTDKPRLGIPLSNAGKLKASESAKKRALTEEGRINVSNAGKISAEKTKNNNEYKKKISNTMKEIWEKRKLGILPMPVRQKS